MLSIRTLSRSLATAVTAVARHQNIDHLEASSKAEPFYYVKIMSDRELMTEEDVHAFGVEIVYKQLLEAGWAVESADVLADRSSHPQIIASKDGETGFFIVRTAMYPGRGRIEGEEVFITLVEHASSHGASCYFASVGIANSEGKSEEDMAIPVKGVAYHVAFDGLLKMELPAESTASNS
jgi:hypothetical protein